MGTITQLFARSQNPPRIVLFGLRDDLVSAWTQLLDPRKFPWVHIYHGEFGDLANQVDAIVVPTNSLGIMESVYSGYFGDVLENKLRARVRRLYHGKMLVGHAAMVSTKNRFFPHVICTTNVPISLVPGKESANAYLATRAVFDLWRFGRCDRRQIRRSIKAIAIPGFGLSDGRVSAVACANQQFKALQDAFSPFVRLETKLTRS